MLPKFRLNLNGLRLMRRAKKAMSSIEESRGEQAENGTVCWKMTKVNGVEPKIAAHSHRNDKPEQRWLFDTLLAAFDCWMVLSIASIRPLSLPASARIVC